MLCRNITKIVKKYRYITMLKDTYRNVLKRCLKSIKGFIYEHELENMWSFASI